MDPVTVSLSFELTVRTSGGFYDDRYEWNPRLVVILINGKPRVRVEETPSGARSSWINDAPFADTNVDGDVPSAYGRFQDVVEYWVTELPRTFARQRSFSLLWQAEVATEEDVILEAAD